MVWDMLTLCADTLPHTDLTYLAFRAAFRETLERIVLAQQVSLSHDWLFGYLTEVPFLQQVAPPVQLDLLAETWSRHCDVHDWEATLLDESVVYAVCETAARLVRNDPAGLEQFLAHGPRRLELDLKPRLAHGLVALHTTFCREGDYLLLTQFLDLPPREARTLKAELGLHPQDEEPFFEALGRWHLTPGFAERCRGLLTERETDEALAILRGYSCRC